MKSEMVEKLKQHLSSISQEEYNNLLQQLKYQQSLYLQYSSGLALGKLENIQKANTAKRECKLIRNKIKLLENEK